MGQADKVRVFDKLADKSLTTKGDLAAMEQNVQGWCDMVKKHMEDHNAILKQAVDAQLKTLRDWSAEEHQTIRGIIDEYRVDELRYRNLISVRGRVIRFRNWLVWLLTFGLVSLGACIGGEPVSGNEYLHVTVDSTRHVACYFSSVTGQHGAGALSCVRVDSLRK